MATEVKLPQLGQGMESGTIVRWLKAEGESVTKREPLYELDTDKVTQEVESDLDGVLLKIVVPEGEVEVGATIAVIEPAGAPAGGDAAAAAPAEPAETSAPAPAPATEEPAATPAPAPAGTVTPRARWRCPPGAGSRRRRWHGASRGNEGSTFPRCRARARTGASSPRTSSGRSRQPRPPRRSRSPEGAEAEVVALTATRKTIARRLTEAWAAPVFQLGISMDMTEALHLREQLVARTGEGDAKPTVNDLLTKLVGVALTRHRPVNATFDGQELRRHAGGSRRHRGRCAERARRPRDQGRGATHACRRSPARAPTSSAGRVTAS